MFWCALLLFLAAGCGGRGLLVWPDPHPIEPIRAEQSSSGRVQLWLPDETDRELGVQKAFTGDFLVAEP